MYGQYRRIRGAFENGVLTGKPLPSGGSLIRPEATGFGAVSYTHLQPQELKKQFVMQLKTVGIKVTKEKLIP